MTSDNWLAIFMLALFAVTAYCIVTAPPHDGTDDEF
ncbi:hypothetical protein P9A30_gp41 [Sphingomonas phage Lucius]|uniref:Uncharacterized protein n=1 Tax=Sphingomonas phage Lucius TaxID=2686313 RepID=A0A6M3T9Y0_9CAUD|nr:hypothetical protein P9A30_gp41 [Sphingomonas phage Lucius]QJD54483.1 hypothetical protein [Sphingomonas phage Lucius]